MMSDSLKITSLIAELRCQRVSRIYYIQTSCRLVCLALSVRMLLFNS